MSVERRLRRIARKFRGPKGPTTAEIAAGILGQGVMTVLDVGARWGSADAWYRVPPLCRVVGFEPDRAECARLSAQAGPLERYAPFALGATAGKATLHVTLEPGCSSLYEPDADTVARYPALRVMRPRGTLEVDVVRLADWAAQDGCADIGFIKLDVQGAELDVLEGAGSLLDGCVGLELEVEFNTLYKGQPLFGDIDRFARGRGFCLWRLSNLVHYGEAERGRLTREDWAAFDNRHVEFEAGEGRLFWGHALYLRDHRGLPATAAGLRQVLLLCSLLEAAGELDGRDAALRHLLSTHRAHLDAAAQERLAALLP